MGRTTVAYRGWGSVAVAAAAVMAFLAFFVFPARADASVTKDIKTASDLARIGTDNLDWPANGTYLLQNDIDLTGYGDGSGWMPLLTFNGTLEGNGYKIKGLRINRPNMDAVGLFMTVSSGGKVRNLTFENVNISGRDAVGVVAGTSLGQIENVHVIGGTVNGHADWSAAGGLIGQIDSGTIINVSSTANVSGGNYVGGLAGIIYRNATLTNAWASGTVSGNDEVGGLIGHSEAIIDGSYATGDVSGASNVGGLVGYMYNDIKNSYATGNVTATGTQAGGLAGVFVYPSYAKDAVIENSYATGNVTGTLYTGGLAGRSNKVLIRNSFSAGNVTGTDYVGGLIGSVGNNPIGGGVSNSYATGDVSGGEYVGGLIGYAYMSPVNDSASFGDVSGTKLYVGGIAGYAWGGTVDRTFSVGAVNGSKTGSDYVGGLIGHSTVVVSDGFVLGNVAGKSGVSGLIGFCNSTANRVFAISEVDAVSESGGICGLAGGASVTNGYYAGNAATDSYGTKRNVSEMAQTGKLGGFSFATADNPARTWIMMPGASHPLLRNANVQIAFELDEAVPDTVNYGETLVLSGTIDRQSAMIEPEATGSLKPLYVAYKITMADGTEAVSGLQGLTSLTDSFGFSVEMNAVNRFTDNGTYKYELWAVTARGGFVIQIGSFELTGVPEVEITAVKPDDSAYASGDWSAGPVRIAALLQGENSDLEYVVSPGVAADPATLTGWDHYTDIMDGTGAITISDSGITHLYIRGPFGSGWKYGYAEVRIDPDPPASPLIELDGTAGEDDWYRSAVTVTITGSDALSGVGKIEYRIDGGDWNTYEEPITIETNGERTVEARVVDKAGNAGPEASRVVKVDLTQPDAPEIVLTGVNGEDGWAGGAVTVDIIPGADALSGLAKAEIKVGDSTWETFETPD